MQHSLKQIASNYSALYTARKQDFGVQQFFEFALRNQDKYHLVKSGDDFFVSTWYSDALIQDYLKTRKQ